MAPITVTTELLDALSATCESHKQRADNLEAEVTALRAAKDSFQRVGMAAGELANDWMQKAGRAEAKLRAAESERDALRAKNQRLDAALRKARAHIAAIHPIRESQMNTVLDIDELLADPPSETGAK